MKGSQIDNFYFIHIPKNAGTAVCKHLLNNNQIGHYRLIDYDSNIHEKTFAIIRCPVSRLLSCYNYFKMDKNYWHNCNNNTKHTLYNFCKTNTFDIFVDNVCNNKFDVNHLKPQVYWLKNKKGLIVSRLIRFEKLEEDISKLLQREIKLPIVNASIKEKFFISDELKEKINNYYKEDLVLYKYLKDINNNSYKMNISIIAAPPVNPKRERFLEIFDNKPLILKVIECCIFDNIELNVIINKKNISLNNYLEGIQKKYKFNILYPDSEKITDTFKKMLQPPGDTIIVCGDLPQLSNEDVKKFLYSQYKSSLCKWKNRWGKNVKGKNGIIRRSNIGDCVYKICQEHKEDFLSEKRLQEAKILFNYFRGHDNYDITTYNDIGTHITYSFFKEIWGDENTDVSEDKGTVFFEKNLWKDND